MGQPKVVSYFSKGLVCWKSIWQNLFSGICGISTCKMSLFPKIRYTIFNECNNSLMIIYYDISPSDHTWQLVVSIAQWQMLCTHIKSFHYRLRYFVYTYQPTRKNFNGPANRLHQSTNVMRPAVFYVLAKRYKPNRTPSLHRIPTISPSHQLSPNLTIETNPLSKCSQGAVVISER